MPKQSNMAHKIRRELMKPSMSSCQTDRYFLLTTLHQREKQVQLAAYYNNLELSEVDIK